jgi:hypothetical protein
MSELKDWLSLAPKPSSRPVDKQWDVFLSYRSAERAWVLSLYDTLRQLGYAVFLDQFVLDPSKRLASTLSEHLRGSCTGILIWSSRSEDSQWCKREYDAFESMEADGGFRYVIARLDTAPLPAFAATKLWVDFSEVREGPRGSSLLRLLFGLHGLALPEPAVLLAAEVDDETKRALARVRAAREDQDRDRILELAKSDHLAWRSSPLLRCYCAEALVAIGAAEAALPIVDEVEREFTKSLRPRQLRGLALARMRRWKEAKAVLGELYELGERDPETVGIYARTWMDSYEASGNELHLRRSRDLYAEAFTAVPSDYYTGINAAAKSVFLNDLNAAHAYAEKVEALVGREPKSNDYWMSATVAEVQLIQRHFADAARLYCAAVAMSPGRVGDHQSTWKQASRLLRCLGPSDAEAAEVAKCFQLPQTT